MKQYFESFMRLIQWAERNEFWLVLLLLPVFVYPIWSYPFFPTLDTPSHIYNANILWNLWFGDNQVYQNYFESNNLLVPNWIAQPLLALLTQIFSSYTCEKIILSLYIIGFILAFRLMILQMKPVTTLVSLMGFIFVYNNSFLLGFVNFNFGIVFSFLSIAALLKFYSISDRRRTLVLFFCMTCLFYAHLVMFCVFGLFTISFLAFTMIRNLKRGEEIWFFRKSVIIKLFAASVIPVTLLLAYLLMKEKDDGIIYASAEKIIADLMRQSGSICVSVNEKAFLRWNWIVPLIGFCVSFCYGLFKSGFRVLFWPWINSLRIQPVIFCFVSLLLIAVFKLPDSTASGSGLLTERLIFQVTVFFFIGVILCFRRRSLVIAMVFALCYVSTDRLFFIQREMKHFQKHCELLHDVSDVISDGGAMTVFNFSNSWPAYHYAAHIAKQKKLLLLDTWTDKYYSSVRWKSPWFENVQLKCWQDFPMDCNLFETEKLLNQKIKWFLIMKKQGFDGFQSDTKDRWNSFLSDSCDVASRSNNDLVLYKRKGM